MKALPAHLPPVPEGYVYLGKGKSFKKDGSFHGIYHEEWMNNWFKGVYGGKIVTTHYCCPIGSTTHILNSGNPRYINHHKKQNDRDATS